MTTDSLRSAFDALPYRNGPMRFSHPARTGAIARLLGVAAQFPEQARVLELGCGEGLNLLPLAAQFPNADFLGIDLSPVQIATAEKLCSEAGLSNARFLCADLREWEPGEQKWDYVIAHGVYSWVPEDVRDRLLAVCSSALAPAGVGYISHNTLPGWGLDYGLRAFLQDEAARVDPANRWPHIRQVLISMHAALQGDASAHASVRRELIAEYLNLGEALLFHDQLSEFNTPVTVTQFIAHAGRHGLAYLSPANFSTAHFDLLPAERQQALAPLAPDFERGQAFMDVLFLHRHRISLLVRKETLKLPRTLDQTVIQECAFRFRAPQPLPPSDAPMDKIKGPYGVDLTLTSPLLQAAGTTLQVAAPKALRWEELIKEVTERWPQTVDQAELTQWLYSAFALDFIDALLASEPGWLAPNISEPERRYADALNRNGMPPLGDFHERSRTTTAGITA